MRNPLYILVQRLRLCLMSGGRRVCLSRSLFSAIHKCFLPPQSPREAICELESLKRPQEGRRGRLVQFLGFVAGVTWPYPIERCCKRFATWSHGPVSRLRPRLDTWRQWGPRENGTTTQSCSQDRVWCKFHRSRRWMLPRRDLYNPAASPTTYIDCLWHRILLSKKILPSLLE